MTNRKLIIFVFILFLNTTLYSQIKIQMRKENGVFHVPCKINGLALDFIFDTGASDVTISLTEARYMLKHGYLSTNDIIGTEQYVIASGEVTEGVLINIKSIEIQGMILNNIRATIVNSNTAPLLLGQSALSKLGKIEIDFTNNILTVSKSDKQLRVGERKYGGLIIGYVRNNKLLIVSENDISKGVTFINAKKLAKEYSNKTNSQWRLPTMEECEFIDSITQTNNGKKKEEIPGISNCTGCSNITYVNELLIRFDCAYYWTSTGYPISYSDEDKIWTYDIGEHSASARNKNSLSAVRLVKIIEL